MKRRDAIKISLAVFMIIVFFNISGYYYLSDAEESDRQEHTLELIGTFYKGEDRLGGDQDKILVERTHPHPEVLIPVDNSESELDNDGISDREIKQTPPHSQGVNQKDREPIVQFDKPTLGIDEKYQHDGDAHQEKGGDIKNSIDSEDTGPETRDEIYDDDHFLQLIRKEHNLPHPVQGNDIVIEPIDDSIATESDIQGLPNVVNDENSVVSSFENKNMDVGKDPKRLGQETMLESNDWDDNDMIDNDRDDNSSGDNHDPNQNDPDDNDLDHDYSDQDDSISHIESEDGEESNKELYPISDLAKETELDAADLDNTYNLTKIKNVDLHNLSFLDNYYRYNYKAIEKRIHDRMEHIRNLCREPNLERNRLGFQRRYNMYQISELGMSWCPVFKSGSTTWRNYFIDMFVSEPPEVYYLDLLKSRQLTSVRKQRIREDGKQLYKDEDEDNVRFSVIRHPYSRLVSHMKSSGRDQEMINQQGIWIQNAMLEGRTRTILNQSLVEGFKAEFLNYFQWLKDGKPGGEFNKSTDNPFLDPPYPTLSELVDHIIKKRRLRNDWDGHWMPGHEFCDICHHSFNYIIKLEEEPLELWFLVDKLGLWGDREVFLNRANSSTKKSTEMLEIWEQLGKLSNTQREFIDNHFDVDFRMFDYKRRKEGQ